ncbi:transposase [Streptococcus pneumoniae]|nr:transposase [Streptococcus pneumoniae]
MSLLETAKRHQLNSEKYLSYLLECLPNEETLVNKEVLEAMTSSKVRKALFLNPRLRISFHTCSMGFISGVYGGINAKPILVGIFKVLDLCHIALSITSKR